MKLADARLCLSCEEVFAPTAADGQRQETCPRCGDGHFQHLEVWLRSAEADRMAAWAHLNRIDLHAHARKD